MSTRHKYNQYFFFKMGSDNFIKLSVQFSNVCMNRSYYSVNNNFESLTSKYDNSRVTRQY